MRSRAMAESAWDLIEQLPISSSRIFCTCVEAHQYDHPLTRRSRDIGVYQRSRSERRALRRARRDRGTDSHQVEARQFHPSRGSSGHATSVHTRRSSAMQYRSCSIGDTCKVRGEISNSVMLGSLEQGTHRIRRTLLPRSMGQPRRGHDHEQSQEHIWKSSASTPEGIRDTGCQFLGTLFGDHVKTGIGTMLTTGTVLSAGANVYGGPVSRSMFRRSRGAMGSHMAHSDREILEVAQRMMARRHVELSEERSSSSRMHTRKAEVAQSDRSGFWEVAARETRYFSRRAKPECLIDAGFSPRGMEKRLEFVDVAPTSIEAVIVTHETWRSCQRVARGARRWGWRILAREGTRTGCASLARATVETISARARLR